MTNTPRPHLVPVYTAARGIVEGPSIRIAEGVTVIGRDEGTGVLSFDGDTLVSRRHAQLAVTGDPWRVTVEDLRSKNGTFVNGRPIETLGLVDGDIIRFGQSVFVVRWRERAEEPASDIGGRAPMQRRMRTAIERIDPHVRRVLLYGSEGCVFDDAVAAVHRRFNPEGQMMVYDHVTMPESELVEALLGTSTVVIPLLKPSSEVLRHAMNAPMAPVVVTSHSDPSAWSETAGVAVQPGFEHTVRIPRLTERREDLLGLLSAALGPQSPPLTIDLIETLLIYGWPGDLMELIEVASELRIRGAGLDALVTELVTPRLRGRRTGRIPPADPKTEVDVRRPVPSKPDLEGLLTIHDGNVDAIASVLGRSRMQVLAWVRHYGLDEEAP